MPFVWVDNGVHTQYNPAVSRNRVEKIHSVGQPSETSEHLEEKQVKGDKEQKKDSYLPTAKPKSNPYQQTVQEWEKEEGKQAFYARQIMNKNVICLYPDTSLDKAWQKIQKHDIRHIPIIDILNHLIGIVSDRDILLAMIQEQQKSIRLTLNDCMCKKVLTVRPEAWIQDITGTMLQEKIGCLPVMSEEGKLLGLVTRSDILRTIIHNPHLDMSV